MIELTSDIINELIETGKSCSLIKQDRNALAAVIHENAIGFPQPVWVKRFNYRGFFDNIIKKLTIDRARRLWNINKKLFDAGFAVAEPITYIESSFGCNFSFFLSHAIEDSDNLADFQKKYGLSQAEGIARSIGRSVACWHMSGAVHGDLKWPNIMLQKSEKGYNCFFVDLDQARLYKKPRIRGIIKDLERFYRSGLEFGAQQWAETRFIPEYKAFLPDKLKSQIDFDDIRNRAINEWNNKGQKIY